MRKWKVHFWHTGSISTVLEKILDRFMLILQKRRASCLTSGLVPAQTQKFTCCSCPCITSQSKGWKTHIFCHEPDHMSINLSYHFAFASGGVTGAHRHLGWVRIRAAVAWRHKGGQLRWFRHLIGMPLGWPPLFGACPVEDPGLGGITIHIHLAGENLKGLQSGLESVTDEGDLKRHGPTLDEQKKYRSDTSLLLPSGMHMKHKWI